MKQTLTITIAIPAYNEEKNIQQLLLGLLRQKLDCGVITKIMVFSDGSTDRTVFMANQVKDKRIVVINRKQRIGVNKVQNQLVSFTTSDILVLLNADVVPANDGCIEALLQPFLKDPETALVGGNTGSSTPLTPIEKIIAFSHEFKKSMYEQLNGGANFYLCHGRIRALSRRFYESLVWPDNCPEDAYSYLHCVSQNQKFAYARNAKILFRSPASLSEHILQSSRFFAGNKTLVNFFSADFLNAQLLIPKRLIVTQLLKALIHEPIKTPLYVVIAVYVKLFIAGRTIYETKWVVPASTKRISIAREL
jgi:cellulose synthase/poly-beta-1,6-N-acetylglucosamine synthase-like glycosyltransferase